MSPFSFLEPLMILAIAGCGLMAGLFFVFSVAVMQALSQLSPAEGLNAMQSINRTILNSVFLTVFFGTAIVCLGLIVCSLGQRQPGWQWAIAGASTYLVGGFVVTATRNVPMNNQLEQFSEPSPRAIEYWRTYQSLWTRWNHVRTIASASAVVMLVISLL